MILNNKEVVKVLNSIERCHTCVGYDDYIIVYGDGISATHDLNQYISDKEKWLSLIVYEYDAIKNEGTIHEANYNFVMESVIKEAVKNKTVAHRYDECDCGAECYNKRHLYFAGEYASAQCRECGRIKVVKRAKFKDLVI